RVLARLSDGLLRGVDMRDLPEAAERQGSDAGIAEEIEELRIFGRAELRAHPLPHGRHIREEPEMAERGALRREAHVVPGKRPALGRHRLGELPAAAAVLVRTGHELAVRPPVGTARGPHGLRLGADEAVAAVALELAA